MCASTQRDNFTLLVTGGQLHCLSRHRFWQNLLKGHAWPPQWITQCDSHGDPSASPSLATTITTKNIIIRFHFFPISRFFGLISYMCISVEVIYRERHENDQNVIFYLCLLIIHMRTTLYDNLFLCAFLTLHYMVWIPYFVRPQSLGPNI